jgi:hypothetical protein
MRNALVKARSGVPWAYRSNTDRAAFTFESPHGLPARLRWDARIEDWAKPLPTHSPLDNQRAFIEGTSLNYRGIYERGCFRPVLPHRSGESDRDASENGEYGGSKNRASDL